MKKLHSLIFLLCSFLACESQQAVDSVAIAYADSIVNSVLKDVKLNEYVFYSIGNKAIVIDKKFDSFVTYYVSRADGVEQKEITSNSRFAPLFDVENYSTNERFSGTKYEASCPSSFIYFRYVKEGTKRVEFNLPSMLLCSNEKIAYPLRDDLHKMLFDLVNNKTRRD